MSSFAAACPHCGRQNLASPKLLLQRDMAQARPGSFRVGQGSPHAHPEDVDGAGPEPMLAGMDILTWGAKWIAELREEWERLSRHKKTAARILFGLAILTVAGLSLFAVFP